MRSKSPSYARSAARLNLAYGCFCLALSCGQAEPPASRPLDEAPERARGTVTRPGSNTDAVYSPGELLWEYRSGLPGPDAAREVAVAEDGTIFAAGWRGTDKAWDRWIGSFTPDGEIGWSRKYDASGVDHAFDIELAASGLFVAGANQTSFYDHELWVGKVDFQGELLWQDTFDSHVGPDYATGLGVTEDGGVVAVGIVSETDGLASLWSRRYGVDGEVVWTQRTPLNAPPLFPYGPNLVIDARSRSFVVGFHVSPAPGYRAEALLAYTLDSGESRWTTQIPNSDGSIYGISLAPGGDLLVAGMTGKPAGFQVRRLDDRGQELWASSQCDGVFGRATAIDSQQNVIAIGQAAVEQARVAVLCKFTPDGRLQWRRRIGDSDGDSNGYSVKLLPHDRILVAGDVWSGGAMWSGGSSDAWLAIYSP